MSQIDDETVYCGYCKGSGEIVNPRFVNADSPTAPKPKIKCPWCLGTGLKKEFRK